MDYAEHSLPEVVKPWIKTVWTLDTHGQASDWLDQCALPDGCLELIHRRHGRSIWEQEQPGRFVAGLATRPANFKVSADAAFVGIRIWPWTWQLLTGRVASEVLDGWSADIPPAWQLAAPSSSQAAIDWLVGQFRDVPVPDLAQAVPKARTVAELAQISGIGHRGIQRWFARVVGLAPSAYLKLMRFQDTLDRIAQDSQPLAHHAVDAGYADQAHMARDMRAIANTRASQLRHARVGPFIAAKPSKSD